MRVPGSTRSFDNLSATRDPLRQLGASADGNHIDTIKPAPALHPLCQQALTACRESGRTAAVISTTPPAEVRTYLDAHHLSTQITVVAPSIAEGASALEASLTNCAVITSSPSDSEAAQAVGVPAVAYAKMPDDANRLVSAGANAFVYSMMDLALSLRAHPS